MVLGGFLVPLLGLVGMLVFSVSLFFNSSLIMVWLYLELASLCLIPLFFSGGFCISLSGLFYYVVFSGASSCLLLMGVLLPDCIFFLLSGFIMKFGIFPLWGWVYRVCSLSNWSVIWGLSTVQKISFLLFPFFLVLSYSCSMSLIFLCSLGCVVLSFFFWFYAYSWKLCWCHMMLSSSSVLIGLSLSGCSIQSLFAVYFIYFIWASLVNLYFFRFSDTSELLESSLSIFFFSFLLLTLPISFSIFYKVVVCSCIFSSGAVLLLGWAIYSFSEQLYLFMLLSGLFSGKYFVGSLDLV